MSMTDITWGDPIEVNGVRPAWIKGDDQLQWLSSQSNPWLPIGGNPACLYDGGWGKLMRFIRLPADHPYYSSRVETSGDAEAVEDAWQPIETAPKDGRNEMFVVIGVTAGNEFTAGRPYTSDPYCVWRASAGGFARWPHHWEPTHWMPLPAPPERPTP